MRKLKGGVVQKKGYFQDVFDVVAFSLSHASLSPSELNTAKAKDQLLEIIETSDGMIRSVLLSKLLQMVNVLDEKQNDPKEILNLVKRQTFSKLFSGMVDVLLNVEASNGLLPQQSSSTTGKQRDGKAHRDDDTFSLRSEAKLRGSHAIQDLFASPLSWGIVKRTTPGTKSSVLVDAYFIGRCEVFQSAISMFSLLSLVNARSSNEQESQIALKVEPWMKPILIRIIKTPQVFQSSGSLKQSGGSDSLTAVFKKQFSAQKWNHCIWLHEIDFSLMKTVLLEKQVSMDEIKQFSLKIATTYKEASIEDLDKQFYHKVTSSSSLYQTYVTTAGLAYSLQVKEPASVGAAKVSIKRGLGFYYFSQLKKSDKTVASLSLLYGSLFSELRLFVQLRMGRQIRNTSGMCSFVDAAKAQNDDLEVFFPKLFSVLAYYGDTLLLAHAEEILYSPMQIKKKQIKEYNRSLNRNYFNKLSCPLFVAVLYGEFETAEYIVEKSRISKATATTFMKAVRKRNQVQNQYTIISRSSSKEYKKGLSTFGAFLRSHTI